MANHATRVIIVGAGVLGGAIGWRLAEAGHEVTLVDPTPGGVASPGSFAWLNASFADDPVYNRLRHDSLELWRRMAESDPAVPVRFDGCVMWEQEHFDLDEVAGSQAELGRPAEMISKDEILRRVPEVTAPPDRALCLLGDGHGDPEEITTWFLNQATAAGANILAGQEAEQLLVEDDRVVGVRTGSRDLIADNVIVAAGINLPHILATIGLDLAMNNEAGLLARTTAGDAMIDTILVAKDLHVWRRDDGGYLIGADFGGGDEPDDTETEAARVLADLQRLLSGTDACSIENVTVRKRPMPRDGRPAIGPFGPKGLYVVSTHSGMTLAPVISECVAAEIGSGAADPRLAPYRPDRPALGPIG